MSAHLMIVAGYMDHLPLSHKLALMKLCDSADDQTRYAYPGLEAVRLWSGTKKSRALEVMKDLQEWGYVMQLTAGHRGKRATYKVFPNPGDEMFSLAAKNGDECPGKDKFAGAPGIPTGDEVKARVAELDGKTVKKEESVSSAQRVQDAGPFEKGSVVLDPIGNGSADLDPNDGERVRSDGERVQNAGRKGPGDWTPSVPTSVPTTSVSLSSPTADAAGDVSPFSDDVDSDHDPAGTKNDRPDVLSLCEHLQRRIVENGSKKPTITKGWLDAARLLLDRDDRDAEKAHALIDWCQDSAFWRKNILSMPTFREKYDQLRLNALEEWESGQLARQAPRRGDIDWTAAMARAEQMDNDLLGFGRPGA